MAINPWNGPALFNVALSLHVQEKYEQALDAWQSIPREIMSSAVFGAHLAWTLFQLGRKVDAWKRAEEALRAEPQDTGGSVAGVQALMLAAGGEYGKAEQKIKSAIEKKAFGHFHHTAHWIASAYARMGKSEPALYWLEQAAETGFPCYPLFERDPSLDSLCKNRRFEAFLGKQKQRWQHHRATLQ